MLTFERMDFDEFHTTVLPARIASGNGALAADDVATAAPFAVQLAGGGAYTYVPTGDSVEVRRGDDGARTVIEFEGDAFSDYANELHSCFGLVYGDRVHASHGAASTTGSAGSPRSAPCIPAVRSTTPTAAMNLDLSRSFTLDDSDDDIAAFLAAAGFAHVRGVFSADEIATLVAETERLFEQARPDDGASWWTTVDGVDACCRLIYSNRGSAAIAALADNPRIRRLHALGDPRSRARARLPRRDQRRDQAAPRHLGPGGSAVAPGLRARRAPGAVPEHRRRASSSIARRPRPASCTSSPVRTSARRISCGRSDVSRLPVVAIDAEPGDVTVHLRPRAPRGTTAHR